MSVALKEKAYTFCEEYIASKAIALQTEIEKLNEALHSETKSTAGDKHETGRAMIQLEREQLGRQLAEAEKMKRVFERVSTKSNTTTIGLGSLVETDKATYFIAISAGRFVIDENEIFCISASTPIAQLLLGKSPRDVINFNGREQKVVKVW